MDDHSLPTSVHSAIDRLTKLIAFPSVSASTNVPINHFVAGQLTDLGFDVVESNFIDHAGVKKSNLVAKRAPIDHHRESGNGLAYFCHTDVVPAKKWNGPSIDHAVASDPFMANVTDGRVYGRGACDMKGSLACMLAAASRVSQDDQTAPIWVVCTADEEVGFDGAKHLVEHCAGYRDLVHSQPISIIGEPTELNVVYAHKGIQGIRFKSIGRAGHSATNYGINANEAMVPMLNLMLDLCRTTRDTEELQNTQFDPPTLSWNFGVSDHSDVVNITPATSRSWVCFRTMPHVDTTDLVAQLESKAQALGLSVQHMSGCDPLWTDPQSECVIQMQQLAGTPSQTVCYGTDGGVLTELNHRIVIGPGSIEQAHTVDEWISIDQIEKGIQCYEKAIRHWCTDFDVRLRH